MTLNPDFVLNCVLRQHVWSSEAWLSKHVDVLQPKRILAASRGFLAAARLSCLVNVRCMLHSVDMYMIHVLMYCVNVGLWSLHRHWTLNSSLRFEEGLILILIFMLVEIDRRETAAALDQQQQQQNGQTSSSRKSKKSRRWWVYV